MIDALKPATRPRNPHFSSGPCAKPPGWRLDALSGALVGRSHRSTEGKARLQQLIELTRELLRVPDGHRIGIVPASDTGAFEMALWSLVGPRGVDALAWDSFGKGWVRDLQDELKVNDLRVFDVGYGELPDLSQVEFDRDVVFTWNGTTSGVSIPGTDWIAADRDGLTICDATSAVFARVFDWSKLDVVTFSWQKVLGGEAAHGMLILSPRAVERLESHRPAWPMPKVFRLVKQGRLNEDIFRGLTINTPSMLCVEDHIHGLKWGLSLGGLDALVARCDANAAIIDRWIEGTSWARHLARDPATRSNTSVCFEIIDPDVMAMAAEGRWTFVRELAGRLAEEEVAYDIVAHRDAPPGLRVWTGATVEGADLEALLPWLDWSFNETRAARIAAA